MLAKKKRKTSSKRNRFTKRIFPSTEEITKPKMKLAHWNCKKSTTLLKIIDRSIEESLSTRLRA